MSGHRSPASLDSRAMAEPGVELGRVVRDHCVNVRYPKDAEAGAGVSVLGDAALRGGGGIDRI